MYLTPVESSGVTSCKSLFFRRLYFTILALVCILSPLHAQTEWVNPFIGTSNFGACNPGAVLPNGMMSVTPFNVMGSQLNTWDKDSRWWSTPYVAENSFFTGYAHVNLSGVGCPELGSLLTMPTTGPLQVDYHLYGSEYKDEEAHPGYYSVQLLNGIFTEATATTRTSLERYTFPAGEGNILLNLGEGLTNESGATVRRVSDTEVEGSKLMGTFCYNRNAVFPIYFVLRVSKAPSSAGYWKKQRPMAAEAAWDSDAGKYKLYRNYAREMSGDDIGCWFHYDNLQEGEQILVQMGVSFVSIQNARENLDAEQQGFQFEAVRAKADATWQQHLGRICVEGGTDDQKTIFYTALYHTLLHPNVLNDVNGEYPLMESGAGVGRVEPGHTRYTVFSLWDTYRNLHQLMTLLWPEKQTDMVRSMIDQYREWGWMPKWELFGRETWTMEGDPAICVIADTWLRGLRDFDIDTAYAAFLKSADTPGAQNRMRPDNDPYVVDGYIPLGYFAGDFSGDNSVSHALEYYVADYALSRLAADLGRSDDAARFYRRSLGYKNYYSAQYKCLRPINPDGTFLTPFDPEDGADFSNAPGFHEGSAWNYSFAVPHDVTGYAKLMGGQKAFVDNLQHVFDEGLYDPANEPDIVYPYLFSRFKGEEKRTWTAVENILARHYKNAPDGIPGNDDTGTMSAWAVFSMLGFYPDCPGEPYFTLTRPSFSKAVISLPGGAELVMSRSSAQSARALVDGRNKGYRISHQDLLRSKSIVWK
ncbi:MAG: GH92 family glycosyl hydrolase [Bacteroidales bacterium]|nr:GH92 family glycosyl hydrolase [Bacteroidales bacterium]